MLVDADTLAQRSASSEVIPRVKVDRGLVKHELFESIVELNSGVCTSPEEALDVVRALRRATTEAAGEIGCTIAAAGSHPTDIATRAEDRGGPALPRLRRVRRPDREAAGRAGTTRPRRHARRGDVPSRPRALHSVAARDPCAVGELAMVRGGAHRAALHTCGDSRPAPAARCTPALRIMGRLGARRRPLRRCGRRARVRRDPLGHPAASEVRDTRGPHARPADRRSAYGRLRRARACACRLGARAAAARPPPRAIAPSSCRTAGPRLASALARSSSTPSATAQRVTARRPLRRIGRAHRRRSA